VSRVFWDTNLFIYLMEDRGAHTAAVTHLVQRMMDRADTLFTSMLTLGELLVHPMAEGNDELCQKYETILSTKAILIPFDRAAARSYALIRQNRSVKPPDAIQLACASRTGIDIFITNDDHLLDNVIPGIQFIVSLKNARL
jgi:predicted nucleic acid-binding protein